MWRHLSSARGVVPARVDAVAAPTQGDGAAAAAAAAAGGAVEEGGGELNMLRNRGGISVAQFLGYLLGSASMCFLIGLVVWGYMRALGYLTCGKRARIVCVCVFVCVCMHACMQTYA